MIKCIKCHKKIHEDDIIWALPSGELSTIRGKPYCMACLPEEPDIIAKRKRLGGVI